MSAGAPAAPASPEARAAAALAAVGAFALAEVARQVRAALADREGARAEATLSALEEVRARAYAECATLADRLGAAPIAAALRAAAPRRPP